MTEQRRDGVFELCALDAEVGGLRERGVELRFSLRDVLVRCQACAILGLSQF